jgi:hypothetical protein
MEPLLHVRALRHRLLPLLLKVLWLLHGMAGCTARHKRPTRVAGVVHGSILLLLLLLHRRWHQTRHCSQHRSGHSSKQRRGECPAVVTSRIQPAAATCRRLRQLRPIDAHGSIICCCMLLLLLLMLLLPRHMHVLLLLLLPLIFLLQSHGQLNVKAQHLLQLRNFNFDLLLAPNQMRLWRLRLRLKCRQGAAPLWPLQLQTPSPAARGGMICFFMRFRYCGQRLLWRLRRLALLRVSSGCATRHGL